MNHRTGFLFEWDGFCDTLKLAFEYDGIQHHEYPNPFYQTYKEFEGQRRRDEMKNYKCEIYGVTLIRIKYDVQNLKEHKVWTEKEKFHLSLFLTYLKNVFAQVCDDGLSH